MNQYRKKDGSEHRKNFPWIRALRAEHLKMKHTFGQRLPVTAALLNLLLVLGFCSGTYFTVSAWNWWYILMLPGMLSILCHLGMKREKKIRYGSLLTAPVPPAACLFGKMAYYALHLCLANLVLFLGTLASAAFWGSDVTAEAGFTAVVLLSLCSLWEIPFFLMVGMRFGIFVSLLSCMTLTIGSTMVLSDSRLWWICPLAVPIRLMCPVLGILPNGLPVPADSPLLNADVILPGVGICLAWFAGLACLMPRCLRRGI